MQYSASSDKALKINRRNRRNSHVDAIQASKIKCFKISEALITDKLELIKEDLLQKKIYDLHYDEEIAALSSRWSISKCLMSQETKKAKLKKKIEERDADVIKMLRPLKEAAIVVNKLFKSEIQDQHEGENDIRFQGNKMFMFYLDAVSKHSSRSVFPDYNLSTLPFLNNPAPIREATLIEKRESDSSDESPPSETVTQILGSEASTGHLIPSDNNLSFSE